MRSAARGAASLPLPATLAASSGAAARHVAAAGRDVDANIAAGRGDHPAIVPSIEGSAFATGFNRLWIDDAAAMPLYQQLDLYGATKRLVWKARGDEAIKGYDMAVKDGK